MYYTDNLFLLTTPCLALHFSESPQFFFFFLTRLHSDTVQLVSYRFSAQTQNCVVFEKQQDNVLKLRVTKDLIMGCCLQIFKSKTRPVQVRGRLKSGPRNHSPSKHLSTNVSRSTISTGKSMESHPSVTPR